jgi:hypothetical protein
MFTPDPAVSAPTVASYFPDSVALTANYYAINVIMVFRACALNPFAQSAASQKFLLKETTHGRVRLRLQN